MNNGIYDELVSWYPMLDPLEEHEQECALFIELLRGAIEGQAKTLLELGAGAGNNGYYLKRAFACTLTDLSAPMLALSRALNPECTHALGDMRTIALDERFDAVVVHDAIVYMLTERDLSRVAHNVFDHLRPGGAALFIPDCVRDNFGEETDVHIIEDEQTDRAMRCMSWMWDPDPQDTTYTVEYAYLLREGDRSHSVHDVHLEGLFSEADWRRVLEGAGFIVETAPRTLDEEQAQFYFNSLFVCRRPSV